MAGSRRALALATATLSLALAACSGAVTTPGISENSKAAPAGSDAEAALSCPGGTLAATMSSGEAALITSGIGAYNAACGDRGQVSLSTQEPREATKAFLDGRAAAVVREGAWGADDDPDDRLQARCPSGLRQLPLAAVPVAVIVNVPGAERLALTPRLLSGLLRGEVKKWNAKEVAAANPDVALPDADVTVFAPQGATANTRLLTGWLATNGAPGWAKAGTATWEAGGRTVRGSAGVAQGVESTIGGIGFVEWAAAKDYAVAEAHLVLDDTTVELTDASGAAATKSMKVSSSETGLAVAGPTAGYPLMRPVYVATCAGGLPAPEATLLKDVLGYLWSDRWQDGIDAQRAQPFPAGTRGEVRKIIARLG